MRGSDPTAALYWMCRMMHGGEDPKFIARRMVIFASEDIGKLLFIFSVCLFGKIFSFSLIE